MLILVGVAIALGVGNNGLLKQAQNAKVETEIAEEKEILNFSVVQAKGEKFNESLETDKLEQSLAQNSNEDNKASLVGEDDEKFFVQFAKNGRVYQVDKDGNIKYIKDADGTRKELTIVYRDSNGTELARKVYTMFGNRYSKVPPQVEGYEAKDEKIEGTISGDKETIYALYYFVIPDSQLVFSEVNNNGEVSYKIGNDSNTFGNGLNSSLTCLSILKIPETHNEKPVISIGYRAFGACGNLSKLTIGSGLTSMGDQAFVGCSNLKTVIIDSSTIASNLSSQTSCGYIVNNATTVYTKTTPGSYIINNFNVATSDIDGYTKYVKK